LGARLVGGWCFNLALCLFYIQGGLEGTKEAEGAGVYTRPNLNNDYTHSPFLSLADVLRIVPRLLILSEKTRRTLALVSKLYMQLAESKEAYCDFPFVIEGDRVNDAFVHALAAKYPELRYVVIRNASVTDLGLAHMGAMGGLRTLDLSGCKRITGAGLTALAGLNHLNSLTLAGCGITSLPLLSGPVSLRTLNLSKCWRLTALNCSSLKNLTALRTLNLSRCTGLATLALAYMANLERLDLSSCNSMTTIDLAPLGNSESLRVVSLWRCMKLTNVTLAPLANLEQLNLSHNYKLVAVDLNPLAHSAVLHTLDLSVCVSLTTLDLTPLVSIPSQLVTVKLRRCNLLTPQGITCLKGLVFVSFN
jgi:Leucine-rich repeat (LRR) protein